MASPPPSLDRTSYPTSLFSRRSSASDHPYAPPTPSPLSPFSTPQLTSTPLPPSLSTNSHYYRPPRSSLTSPTRSNISSPTGSPTRSSRQTRLQSLLASDPLLSRLTPVTIARYANDPDFAFTTAEKEWSIRAADGIVKVSEWLREVEGWNLNWRRAGGRRGSNTNIRDMAVGYLPPNADRPKKRRKLAPGEIDDMMGSIKEVEEEEDMEDGPVGVGKKKTRRKLFVDRSADTSDSEETPEVVLSPPVESAGRSRKPLTPYQLKMQRQKAAAEGETTPMQKQQTPLLTPQQTPVTAKRNGETAKNGHYEEETSEEEEEEEEEYWGSLKKSTVEMYEARIAFIKSEIEELDVEALKSKVLSYRTGITNPLTDSSAIITATTLQLLPPLHRLTKLLSLWTVRLAVLRIVPVFLRWLSIAKTALDAGYAAITHSSISPNHPSNTNTTIWRGLEEETYTLLQETITQKVATAGRLMDTMLDALEGREDVLPDIWISELEEVEERVGAWEMDGERIVLEGRLRLDDLRHSETRREEMEREREKTALVLEQERSAREAEMVAYEVDEVMERAEETERGLREAMEANEVVADGIELGETDGVESPVEEGNGEWAGRELLMKLESVEKMRMARAGSIGGSDTETEGEWVDANEERGRSTRWGSYVDTMGGLRGHGLSLEPIQIGRRSSAISTSSTPFMTPMPTPWFAQNGYAQEMQNSHGLGQGNDVAPLRSYPVMYPVTLQGIPANLQIYPTTTREHSPTRDDSVVTPTQSPTTLTAVTPTQRRGTSSQETTPTAKSKQHTTRPQRSVTPPPIARSTSPQTPSPKTQRERILPPSPEVIKELPFILAAARSIFRVEKQQEAERESERKSGKVLAAQIKAEEKERRKSEEEEIDRLAELEAARFFEECERSAEAEVEDNEDDWTDEEEEGQKTEATQRGEGDEGDDLWAAAEAADRKMRADAEAEAEAVRQEEAEYRHRVTAEEAKWAAEQEAEAERQKLAREEEAERRRRASIERVSSLDAAFLATEAEHQRILQEEAAFIVEQERRRLTKEREMEAKRQEEAEKRRVAEEVKEAERQHIAAAAAAAAATALAAAAAAAIEAERERKRRKAEAARFAIAEGKRVEAEAKRLAEEEAERIKKLEAEKLAARLKVEEAEAERQRQVEAERLAAIETARLAAEAKAKAEEAERLRLAEEEAEQRVAAEAERQRKLEAERLAALEAARLAAEEEAKAEAERMRLAEEKAERQRIAAAKAETERLAFLEEARLKAEAEEKAEVERQRRVEAERLAALEAARLKAEAKEKARAERIRLAEEEAERQRIAAAEAEAERQRKLETERLAALEVARLKAEAEEKAEEEAESQRIAAAEAEAKRLASLEAARLEAEAKEKAEAERIRLAEVEAERQRIAAAEAEAEAGRQRRAEAERLAALEAARLKAEAEEKAETERIRLADEETERQHIAAAAAAAAAEAERIRLAEEEAERQRIAAAAAAEAERQRLIEEAARAAAAEERRKAAEAEVERQRLIEEEAERQRELEAERMRLAEEVEQQRIAAVAAAAEAERQRKIEAERLAALEVGRLRAEAEAMERVRRAEQVTRQRKAEHERRAAIEARRLAAEKAERQHMATLEAERRKAIEEEAQRNAEAHAEAIRRAEAEVARKRAEELEFLAAIDAARVAEEEDKRERMQALEAERLRIIQEEAEAIRVVREEEAERQRVADERKAEVDRQTAIANSRESERRRALAEQSRLAAEAEAEAEREISAGLEALRVAKAEALKAKNRRFATLKAANTASEGEARRLSALEARRLAHEMSRRSQVDQDAAFAAALVQADRIEAEKYHDSDEEAEKIRLESEAWALQQEQEEAEEQERILAAIAASEAEEARRKALEEEETRRQIAAQQAEWDAEDEEERRLVALLQKAAADAEAEDARREALVAEEFRQMAAAQEAQWEAEEEEERRMVAEIQRAARAEEEKWAAEEEAERRHIAELQRQAAAVQAEEERREALEEEKMRQKMAAEEALWAAKEEEEERQLLAAMQRSIVEAEAQEEDDQRRTEEQAKRFGFQAEATMFKENQTFEERDRQRRLAEDERQRLADLDLAEREKQRLAAQEAERLKVENEIEEARIRAELAREEQEIEEARIRAELARKEKEIEEARIRAELERKEREIEEARIRAELERKEKEIEEVRIRAELERKEKEIEEVRIRAELERKEKEIEEARVRAELAREEQEIEEARIRAEIAREEQERQRQESLLSAEKHTGSNSEGGSISGDDVTEEYRDISLVSKSPPPKEDEDSDGGNAGFSEPQTTQPSVPPPSVEMTPVNSRSPSLRDALKWSPPSVTVTPAAPTKTAQEEMFESSSEFDSEIDIVAESRAAHDSLQQALNDSAEYELPRATKSPNHSMSEMSFTETPPIFVGPSTPQKSFELDDSDHTPRTAIWHHSASSPVFDEVDSFEDGSFPFGMPTDQNHYQGQGGYGQEEDFDFDMAPIATSTPKPLRRLGRLSGLDSITEVLTPHSPRDQFFKAPDGSSLNDTPSKRGNGQNLMLPDELSRDNEDSGSSGEHSNDQHQWGPIPLNMSSVRPGSSMSNKSSMSNISTKKRAIPEPKPPIKAQRSQRFIRKAPLDMGRPRSLSSASDRPRPSSSASDYAPSNSAASKGIPKVAPKAAPTAAPKVAPKGAPKGALGPAMKAIRRPRKDIDSDDESVAEEPRWSRSREHTPDWASSPPAPSLGAAPRLNVTKKHTRQPSNLTSQATPDKGKQQNQPRTPHHQEVSSTSSSAGHRPPKLEFPQASLDDKVNEILTALASPVRLTASNLQKLTETTNKRQAPLRPFEHPSGIPGPKSIGSNPSITSDMTSLSRGGRKHVPSTPGGIELYHLHRTDGQAPIKLYIRLVGERGERVMVRVGGGWADLAEYLKEYATHHGSKRRVISGNGIEIEDLGGTAHHHTLHPSRSISSLRSASPAPGSRSSSPLPTGGRSRSTSAAGLNRRAESPMFGRRSESPSLTSPPPVAMRGGHNGTLPTKDLPVTPTLTAFQPLTYQRQSGLSPPTTQRPPSRPGSSHSAVGAVRRSASRLSFTESAFDGSEVGILADPPKPLGLAGPKGKKNEISPENQAWVEGMLGEVRKVSANRRRRLTGGSSNGEDMMIPGETVEFQPGGRLGISDMGKQGATRRVFPKKQG